MYSKLIWKEERKLDLEMIVFSKDKSDTKSEVLQRKIRGQRT